MRTHLPTDCALVFAIPLSERDFFSGSQSTSDRGYAQQFKTQLGSLSDEEIWAKYEQAVVQPALSAIEFAEARGVRIECRATLDVVQRIIQERVVLSLVAHWHTGGFVAATAERLPGLIPDICTSEGPAGRSMAAALADTVGLDSVTPSVLTSLLNRRLRTRLFVEEDPHAGVTWVANDEEQIFDRNFTKVREEFPKWSLQPAAIELAYHIHSVPEIISIISSEYEGTIDLRMCHS